MSLQFIRREDFEGNNGNSVTTEDNDNDDTNAEAGEYVAISWRSGYTAFERGISGGRHQ